MKQNRFITWIAYGVLIIISFIMVYPFLWMLFGSFKTNQEIIQYPLSLIPQKWVLNGWKGILTLSGNSLWHYFKNSIIISGGSTLLVVLATSLGGYALYRKGSLFHDPDLFFGKHDVSGRAAAHTPVCDRGSAGAVWNQQFLGDHIGVFHRRMGSGPSLFPV